MDTNGSRWDIGPRSSRSPLRLNVWHLDLDLRWDWWRNLVYCSLFQPKEFFVELKSNLSSLFQPP